MKMEQTECSETSAYKFQTLGIHPKESIQHGRKFAKSSTDWRSIIAEISGSRVPLYGTCQ